MADSGWVYAYRKAWTHPAFNNLREAAIWNFLYQNAFWADGERNFNSQTYQLKRGQIIISMRFLAKGFCMSEKGARLVIQKLEKLGMLVTQRTNRGTIITICNYNEYQSKEKTEDEPRGKQRTHRGRTEDANKNEPNEGNEPNEVIVGAFASYNSVAEKIGIPQAQKLSKSREGKLKARLKDCGGIDGWNAAMAKLSESAFLSGQNNNGWKADLDFVLQEKTFTKLMEGSYDNRKGNGHGAGAGSDAHAKMFAGFMRGNPPNS